MVFSEFHHLPRCATLYISALVVAITCAYGQETSGATGTESKTAVSGAQVNRPDKIDKRAFGIFPNYRSADASSLYQPIGPRQKFAIAARDSFDWPLLFVAAGFAGLGQITNQNPSFGQGTKGYANRYVRIYTDLAVGNMLTEGVLPSLFDEDPRYFRRGQGKFRGRMWYATSRIFVTRMNSGKTRFNFSEVVGNSITVGISNAYYPDTRTAGDNFEKLTIQLATDALSNVLKEFWPDVKRRLSARHQGNKTLDIHSAPSATAAATGTPPGPH